MPAAPCSTGSTTTAAIAPACSREDARERLDRARRAPRLARRRHEARTRSARPRRASGRPRRRRSRWRRASRRGRRPRARRSAGAPGRPFCAQYWSASLSATSTAVEPSSLKKTCSSPAGATPAERLGQLRRGLVRDARERRVASDSAWRRERGDQARVRVAERRRPPGGVAVEIAAPVRVEQARALRAHDHERIRAPPGSRSSRCRDARPDACRARRSGRARDSACNGRG